jgi:outer membrane receptor protein involved in Fe transport
MNSLDTMQPRHTELGVSVFNTSILSAGTFPGGDSRWLVSARRSNLEIFLDSKKHGRPNYYDIFAEVSFDLTPDVRLSLNGLYADDGVTVVLESEPSELEQVTSETQNAQFWVTLENQWSPVLRSISVVSLNSFSNHRLGETNDAEEIVSDVDDRRSVDQYGFRQDWLWNQSDIHLVQWGFQAENSEARYDYTGQAEFFGLAALYQDVDETISRDLSAAPVGNSFAVYLSDRWKVARNTIVELGLRWDDQTYTGLVSDSQLSPRLSVLHAISPQTEFRFSWGRYHQSQGIHELQIEDGVTSFFPAQRADHLIAGIRHSFNNKVSVRLELFQKDMSRLRPRFENLFDSLALIPELQPDRVRIAPSEAQARGLEVSIDRSSESFTWWVSYTLSEVNDTVDGIEEARSWDQRHSLIAGLNWNSGAWDFSLAANVHSGWPTTGMTLVDAPDPADDPIAIPGPRNAERLGTFASVDARISRRFRVGKGTITAFFEVANLFDRKNLCCRDYDLADDTDDVLDLSDDYWLPRLPAVGFLWEFQ